ncbi:polysaccharide deacetylase family protein [Baekduia sp. Peel2402]|uniref:polysaccharide deacetylase family protein n=1 Tax=Baekduia sp. Peel2402 TaxID=3458296 RepID=UPI00403EC868
MKRCATAILLALVFAGCGSSATESAERPALARAAAPPVPILLYHHIADPPPGERNASLWTTRARFSQQLTALQRAGFHAVTLDRVWRAWHGGPKLPSKPVVISFDDGFAEQDAIARPALARRGWRGVLNLQLNHLNIPGGLSRAAIGRFVDAGWEVDDHSATHPDLTKISGAQLRAEITGSRATFRAQLGIDPKYFCYPYGKVNARVRAAVRAAGFKAATTILPGRATVADDPMMLPRIIVRRSTTPAGLVRLASRG